jgi:beta-lactamase class D
MLEKRADWAQLFADRGVNGVFVLWEPDRFRLQTSDTARAAIGFLPASTFKVFNSLVALQTGAVADEHTIIPWDSVMRQNPGWNEDMDMATAIQRSCVPWYQEVARRAGAERMQHWLDTVHYGNAVIGDSIHLFWLSGGLRITPLQQVRFMQRLNEERLPFDVAHQRTVKRILPGDSTATGRIKGKTGWAIRVDEQYGWYVGWVERAGGTAYFAINIDMPDERYVPKRQSLARELLVKEGWLDQDAL